MVGLSGFMAGCGSAAEEPSPEELTAKATTLVESMTVGDFSATTEDFDSTMKSVLPPERIEEEWEALATNLGAFQEQTGTRIEGEDGYEVVYVTCEFEDSSVDVKVVFNDENQVAGLFFVPVSGSTEQETSLTAELSEVPRRASPVF